MSKLRSVQLGQVSADDALEYLAYFGQALKGIQNDAKKRFYATFIGHIEIYENADWKNGEDIVKKIRFKIPLTYGGQKTFELTHLEDEKGKPTQKVVKAENFRGKENTDEALTLMVRESRSDSKQHQTYIDSLSLIMLGIDHAKSAGEGKQSAG